MKAIAEIIEGHPLIHANPSDNVREVARMMSDRNVGAIAVLDSGRLVGVFSERDLMARVVATGLNPDDTPVANVMTKELIVAEAGEGVDDETNRARASFLNELVTYSPDYES